MTEQASLDTILTGSTIAETHTPDEPKGEADKAQETVAEPAKEAAPPAVEKAPDDKPPHGFVPQAALLDERRRRQDYERELAELRKAKTDAPKPNLFESPEEWEKALETRLTKEILEVRQESEQRFLALVEQAAKARHTDFEAMAQVFAETARTTPGLIDEARNAPDPAEFIYRAGQNLKRVQDAGSIEALIERAREEGRQEALKGKVTPKIPESLTEIAGATGDTGKKPFSPTSLKEILPRI